MFTAVVNDWRHYENDLADRISMIRQIIGMFRSLNRNPSVEWERKLPTMVKNMEHGLYYRASTKELYMDRRTLKMRLRELALTFVADENVAAASSSTVRRSRRRNYFPLIEINGKHVMEKEECCICQEDFILGSKVSHLLCKHLFHPHCINPWIIERGNTTCPKCRAEVVV